MGVKVEVCDDIKSTVQLTPYRVTLYTGPTEISHFAIQIQSPFPLLSVFGLERSLTS